MTRRVERRASSAAGGAPWSSGSPTASTRSSARPTPTATELSGGQWQRLAIARGMMPRSNRCCLILDEPTAALDPEAEQRLFESYPGDRARHRPTSAAICVLISHRFSSVRMADDILVLSKGTVIEHGTHQQLMATDGHYAAMYRQQADAYS